MAQDCAIRMPTSVILITVLVILSCVIAYVSDNMGKKLGKKRISLLGMRPRQTATALTMASSVGIMFVTLLVVSLFSRQVRSALLRVDTIRERNKELRDRNQVLKASAASLNAQLSALQKRVQSTQKTVQAANRNAQQANQKANTARQQLESTQEKLTGTQSDLRSAQQTLREAQRGERTARGQAAAAQKLYAVAQNRAEAANKRAAAADARAAFSQTRLARASQQLTNVNQRLKDESGRLADIRSRLTDVRARLSQTRQRYLNVSKQYLNVSKQYLESYKQVVEADNEQKRLQLIVTELRERETEQQAVVNRLFVQRQELEQLVRIASRVLEGNVAVPAGRLFATRTLPPGSSIDEAASALRALLARGNEVVVKQGWRALHLAPLLIERGNEGVELNEDDILRNLATYLSSFDTPVSVRLTAARDHAPGEAEILGRLLAVPVRRAFARNETIVTATMSGTESDARLFNQFLKMVSQGEQVASQRGVAPLLTEEDPNFFASGTNERIFEALRQVQSRNSSVTVRLVASDDLTTVEPLRVRFEVDAS